MTRRSILGLLVAGAGSVVAGVVSIPALLAGLSPALRPRREEMWRPVGRLADFPVGAVSPALVPAGRAGWPRSFRQQAVFLWRRSADELVVFSRSCTDLGCPLEYEPGSACYFCPCHGGIFAQDGSRLAGPPDRPMYRYAHRVTGGVLEIDLASVPPAA